MTVPRRLVALALTLGLVATGCGIGSDPTPPDDGVRPPECLSFADLYALVGPESIGINNWSGAQPIAAELGSSTEFPDLRLTVTAPGEESGTFDSFVELVIEDLAEERGLPEDEWLSRPDYQASANDSAIIDGIANSTGSLGWVGYAFFEENAGRVRAFTITEEPGGECVEPTAETIASNDYPIARDLFVYVNLDKAAANPAIAAYVDFYLADGTIGEVLQTVPYVALGDDALAATRAAWESERPANASPDGTVFVTGSSTVEPISNGVAEAFKAQNAGFNYTVEGPGTGDGFAKFCAGQADIADASREIRESEIEDCEAAGIEYVELKVAIDGIAVVTRRQDPDR